LDTKKKAYDYLIVGAGLYGAVFAHEAKKKGKRCLVVDKRNHLGGNTYCENIEGINVHKYGAHIFHTNNKEIWDYVNSFVTFNRYTNSPIANYKGALFNLPFNMNTFYQLWKVTTPEQAYTEKQWGRKAIDLPSFIIKRLPLRYTFDNNYFNDTYQGIPIGGYNKLIDGLLEGVDCRTNVDFFKEKESLTALADNLVFTGKIDEYYEYCHGQLEYRSLDFIHKTLDTKNYQGNAVVNYTEGEIPYTRIIEHKHFEFGKQEKTVITKEYPSEWSKKKEPYYPINDAKNTSIYSKYKKM